MFGWEFPPFKAGGLATATVGLVTGLLGRGIEVCLVVPFAVRESNIPGLDLVSAPASGAVLTRRRIDAALVRYTNQSQYAANAHGVFERPAPERVYGADLMADVEREWQAW